MVCSRSPLAWPTAKRGLRPSYRKTVEPCQPCKARVGETTAVAHGGNHGSRSWGRPPRPRCLPKTALPPQDRANHANQ
ncbi:hypothetical protein [Moorena producens]|uniref:hypothetical protein n=1 Tax=Moorena producens TaxID=1155739 RepID=UPI0011EA6657|nr:hypothetical protein [Moorena producens]